MNNEIITMTMKMETAVNTIDKTNPNNRNTSLKILYPRYIPTMVEIDAPNACTSTITTANPGNHLPDFMMISEPRE
jgi:hypothetical protein